MAKPAAPKRQPGQPKRGPLPWEPTPTQRTLVEIGVASGLKQDEIASALGVSVDSLARHCRKELDTGGLGANLKVGGALFAKCMKGDVASIIWWEKTRAGMKDLSRVEHTGKDGGPIEYKDLDDDEIDARINALTNGDGPSVTTH